MKREKTKHKGVYKVGDTYYITYYVGSKKYEKTCGPRLSMALKEKMERESRAKRGNYEALERQEKMTFDQLRDLYQREGDGKKYIIQFIPACLKHFGSWKLSQISRKDLFKFRDALKATPKQRGRAEGRGHRFMRQSSLSGSQEAFQLCGIQGIPCGQPISQDFQERSLLP